jgi:hypothetical protein
VIHRNDAFAVQKHFITVCFICASTVPVGHCQNTAAIGHGINSKAIRSSTRFIRKTCKEGVHVYARRVARVLLRMSHACLLSRQKGDAGDIQEDDSNQYAFVTASFERFRAHFAENTTINSVPSYRLSDLPGLRSNRLLENDQGPGEFERNRGGTSASLCCRRSFLAQQCHRIDRQRALRWNPRSQQPEQRHGQDNASQYQRVARSRLIYDEGEHTARQDSEEQAYC